MRTAGTGRQGIASTSDRLEDGMANKTNTGYELDRYGMARIRALESRAAKTKERSWRDYEKEMAEGLAKLSADYDIRLWYDGCDLRHVALPKGTAGEPIRITCYRRTEEWLDRNNAMSFYYEGVMMCDGCERDRYTDIFMQLGAGCMDCTDENYLR